MLTNFSRGWGEWIGDFTTCNAIGVDTYSGILLLSLGSKVYRYADGDVPNYADRAEDAIAWDWLSQWFKPGRGRWANRRAALITEPGGEAEAEIYIAKNYDLRNQLSVDVSLPKRAYWGLAQWDETKSDAVIELNQSA